MKKIVSVVFDDFLADPRAQKFYEALNLEFDVKVLSLELLDAQRGSFNIAIKIESHNRFVRLFRFWCFVFRKILELKPDYILAHNFYMGLPCYYASKRLRIPFIYDAYEFYYPRKGNPFSKRDWFFFLQERVAIKNASLVFAANIERARLMKRAYGLKQRPVDVLNIPIYNEKYITKEKSNVDIEEKFSIIYEGFISFTRFIDKLVDSLEYLPGNFELTIVGDGADSEKLKVLIDSKPYSDRIRYLGRILNKDILPTISKCDIGFVGYPFSDLNNIFCSPNKIYEYPAAGIPFVSTKQHPIWAITKPYQICEFYNPFTDGAKDIAKALLKISNNYSHYTAGIVKFNVENNWYKEKDKIRNAVLGID